MNIYENVVIINPNLSDEEIKVAVDKISDLITNAGGEIVKVDSWGRRKLAYEINKHKMGSYFLFIFKAPSQVVRKIEDYFKVFDLVIKFMVIRLTPKQVASVMPKEKEVSEARSEAKG